MDTTPPASRSPETSNFALKYCIRCAAGWTRYMEDGSKVIYCLLDQEPARTNIVRCDRYALRTDEEE